MTITDKEYKVFLTTHLDLLFYVGQQTSIIPNDLPFRNFVKLDLSVKVKCRDFLNANDQQLDSYLSLNFERLSTDQIQILSGFKRKIAGEFVILKCLKKHAVFIDISNNRFYAVKALRDRFDYFFDKFPVLIDTVLLPFNNQIIYDGFIKPTGVYFGSRITKTMKEDYKEVKSQNLILKTI